MFRCCGIQQIQSPLSVTLYFLTKHAKNFVFPFQWLPTHSFQEFWIFFPGNFFKKKRYNYSILKLTSAVSVHRDWVSPSVSLELTSHVLIIKVSTAWPPGTCWFALLNNWTPWTEFSLNKALKLVLFSPGTEWLFGGEVSTPMAATTFCEIQVVIAFPF